MNLYPPAKDEFIILGLSFVDGVGLQFEILKGEVRISSIITPPAIPAIHHEFGISEPISTCSTREQDASKSRIATKRARVYKL